MLCVLRSLLWTAKAVEIWLWRPGYPSAPWAMWTLWCAFPPGGPRRQFVVGSLGSACWAEQVNLLWLAHRFPLALHTQQRPTRVHV